MLPPSVVSRLRADADGAAARAGVRVRGLRADEMAAASALLARVWGAEPDAGPMEPGLLVALGFTGSYVTGAFVDDTLVGTCVGFFGEPHGALLHSHIAAVRPGGPRGTGTALKRHQRTWCAERGIETIAWTYDPLVARNAWFNLGRLGVHVVDYLVNFYGTMDDGLNAGQESDRLLVHWAVDPAAHLPIVQAPTTPPADPYAALAVGPDGAPAVDLADGADARTASLAVPADVETLRRTDPALATRWRTELRAAYADLRARGWHVVGFDRDHHHYLLERP